MKVSKRLVLQSTLGFLIVGFVALLAIVAMTFWLGQRAQVYFGDVIAARDARGAAVELRNAVQTAESSQRGFLFTGNEIYLAPYDTAKTVAQRQLDAMRRSLQPANQADVRIQRLAMIVSEKFAEMDRTIALKRSRQDTEALALFRTNRGKALMDEINIFASGAIRVADERLTAGVGEQKANAALLRSFSLIGALFIVVVVGGAVTSILLYNRELRGARDEVGILNAELEKRVADRTADLEQANEEIKRFAYIVTHDLRAPLVNILGFTGEVEGGLRSMQQLIESAGLGEDAANPLARSARIAWTEELPEAIGFIRSSATKMNGLIDAILKLSREGRRALRPEPLDLAEVIGSSVATVQHQLSQAHGTVNLDLRIPSVVMDRLSLEQILGNLVDNAVKYRSAQRALRIDIRTSQAPDERLLIEVADNGRGIADGDHDRVFDLFRRAGVQDQPGEGIGLAYVRTLVRNLGGDIGLTSGLDRGTTFRVTLPHRLALLE